MKLRAIMINALFSIFVFGGVATVHADRGAISFHPNVKIFEPNQKALIAWNGETEILVLTTNLRAAEPTKILEVLPLPSEPEVHKGDSQIFSRAVSLINRAQIDASVASNDASGGIEGGKKDNLPAGEIVFHDRIGAQDIAIARVDAADGFVQWVEKYLAKEGVPNPTVSNEMKTIIEAYLKDGFRWFAFNVVSLSPDLATNEALKYKFKTDKLYYPMRITGTAEGSSAVTLIVITPTVLSTFPGIPRSQIILEHDPVSLNRDLVKYINSDLADFFPSRYFFLRTIKFRCGSGLSQALFLLLLLI